MPRDLGADSAGKTTASMSVDDDLPDIVDGVNQRRMGCVKDMMI